MYAHIFIKKPDDIYFCIFSAYGDAWFLLLQTLIIAFLVLKFTKRQLGAILYCVGYLAILWFLLSHLVPYDLLWYLQASVLPNVVIARVCSI